MFESNGFLNLIVLGSDPWVVDIAVGIETGKGFETFVWAVVVDEPTMGIILALMLNHYRLNEDYTHRGLSGNMKIRAAVTKLFSHCRYLCLASEIPRKTAGIT